MKDWVKIKTNIEFASKKGQSPIVKCLLHDRLDRDYFFKQISIDLKTTNLSDSEKFSIVNERVDRIIDWRNLLRDKFGDQIEQKELCILSLGHLISARYSGKAQSYDAIEYTLTKLSNAIADKQPIVFTFCFGGYKCHTSPAHPQVDWAELFNMNYLISYLYPIIKAYKYGVEIEYESEEVSIQFNNVPQEQTDKYTDSFKKLINYYTDMANRKYGLSLTIRLVIARELYEGGVSKLYDLINEKKPLYYEKFNSLSDYEKNKWIQRAESNYMWENGIKEYGELSDAEKYEIYKEARVTNEAFLDADYILRENWFENPYRVPLTGTWGTMPSAQPIDGWLHIKSTEGSKVDCWIGTGSLEAVCKNGVTEYVQMILSKSQLKALKNKIEHIDNDDNDLQKVSKNFYKVPIYHKED